MSSDWRSRSRDGDRRDGMDRGRRDDRSRDYHDSRGRPDARDRGQGWGGRRDHFDRRRDDGPRSGTDDGRGRGAPRPSGGRQFETRHDSQGLQHVCGLSVALFCLVYRRRVAILGYM